MGRSKTGQAISATKKTLDQLSELDALLDEAEVKGDLAVWKRARGVRAYIEGDRVVDIAAQVRATRGSVNFWLRWYEVLWANGLRTETPPGGVSRLTLEQREELTRMVEAWSIEAGFTSGGWTGPMIGRLTLDRFGVGYHNHRVPRLLDQLGFASQRPRKRLARAGRMRRRRGCASVCQRSKKAAACRGVVVFEDEGSFWFNGTLHETWSRKGVQPRVDTYGLRKTAHLFGAVSMEEEPQFTCQFSDVFNGHTFHQFLELSAAQYLGWKVFS